jgi:hypothetical protein
MVAVLSYSTREGILSCLESALKPFGDNFSSIVFWNLKQREGISKEEAIDHPEEEAIDHPEELVKCLHGIFGSGSKLIELRISLELKNKFNLSEAEVVSCSTALRSARRHLVMVTV